MDKTKKKGRLSAIVAAVLTVAATLVFGACADKSDNSKPTEACLHEHTTEIVTVNPSCVADGASDVVCDKCKTVVETKVLPAFGHDYAEAETTGLCVTCRNKICSPGLFYRLSEDGNSYKVSGKYKEKEEYENDEEDSHAWTFCDVDSDLVIPEYHDGKPVTVINQDAFNSRGNIKSLSIPSTVQSIGVGAFNGCSALRQIYYDAENVADFRGINWVFYYGGGSAPELSVTFGRHVKRIPARMFYPHNADSDVIPYIKRLVFEADCNIQSIGDYAFYKTNIASIALPDSLEELGEHVFESSSVEQIKFGTALKRIGAHAFDYCNDLEFVDLSRTAVGEVCDSAFRNCAALASVKLPNNPVVVGDKAFYGCTALTNADLGNARSVGAEAFLGCSALKKITLPVGLKTLGVSAFEGCSAVEEIEVQSEAMEALLPGNRAFYGAGSADGVTVRLAASAKSVPDRLFFSTADYAKNLHIKSLVIEVGVESIGDYAFRGTVIDGARFSGTQAQYAAVSIGGHNDEIGMPVFGAEV